MSPSLGAASLLATSLQLAVPLTIWQMRTMEPAQIREVAAGCADVIAAHGDDLLYGGRDCAPAFNALARGLAALAHQPGGVTFADLHWCVTAHEGCPNHPAQPKEEHHR